MEAARGGVLFIDEAYGLNPIMNICAKGSIEMLLSNLTDPKYEGNMIVVLAGYIDQIDKLFDCNPGLRR